MDRETIELMLKKLMFSPWSPYAWAGITIGLWALFALLIREDPLWTIFNIGFLAVAGTIAVLHMFWKRRA